MTSLRHIALTLKHQRRRWIWDLLREGWAERFDGVYGN